MSFTASNSFETIGGNPKQTGLGGGGAVTGLWKGLFVDVGASQQKIAGERVFINGDSVFRLGIPVSITIRSVDVAAGWRFTRGRVTPYAGSGMSFVAYRESDDFAAAGDSVDEQASGTVVLGGVDIAVLRFVQLGAEVRHKPASPSCAAMISSGEHRSPFELELDVSIDNFLLWKRVRAPPVVAARPVVNSRLPQSQNRPRYPKIALL
jgi:hypothetical protein